MSKQSERLDQLFALGLRIGGGATYQLKTERGIFYTSVSNVQTYDDSKWSNLIEKIQRFKAEVIVYEIPYSNIDGEISELDKMNQDQLSKISSDELDGTYKSVLITFLLGINTDMIDTENNYYHFVENS